MTRIIIADPDEWSRVLARVAPSPLRASSDGQSFRLGTGQVVVFRPKETLGDE